MANVILDFEELPHCRNSLRVLRCKTRCQDCIHPEGVPLRKSLCLCLCEKKRYPEADGFWEPEPGKQSPRGNIRKRKTTGARITETGGRINKCGRPASPEKAGPKVWRDSHPSFYINGWSK
jgi:hypothetical protein